MSEIKLSKHPVEKLADVYLVDYNCYYGRSIDNFGIATKIKGR